MPSSIFPKRLNAHWPCWPSAASSHAPRYLLESRYHHLLVDEFQDTSEAQWQLVWHLVQSWREGIGHGPGPAARRRRSSSSATASSRSMASATPMRACWLRAAVQIRQLRGDRDVSRAIRQSFRAVPPLLSFTNDLCMALDKRLDRDDAFTYDERDEFPVPRTESGAVEHGHCPERAGSSEPTGATRPDCRVRPRVTGRRGRRRDRARHGSWRGARSPDGRRRAGPAPATSRSCFARGTDIRPSSGPWSSGAFPATSTKGWASSTPTRSKTCSRRCVPGRPGFGAASRSLPAIAVRASVRCRARRLAPGLAAAMVRPAECDGDLDADDRRSSYGPAPCRAGRGWLWPIASGRRSCSTTSSIRPPTPTNSAALTKGRPADRPGRISRRCAGWCVGIENRGYATLARVADYLDRLSAR